MKDQVMDAIEAIEKLYQQQRGRCAVTGIRFSMERWEKALVKHPFAPSIDRRDSELGYTDENVRLVCVATNFGMGQWGEGVFLSLAHAAAELENQRRRGLDVLKGSTDAGSWYRRQQQRIEAAEKVRSLLSGEAAQGINEANRRVKSSPRKGPGGLKDAGGKAADAARLMRIREAALRIFTDALKAELAQRTTWYFGGSYTPGIRAEPRTAPSRRKYPWQDRMGAPA
jgi:hypothetical protein